MYATTWYYYVPYQTDISSALRELRRRVYQSQAYFDPYREYGTMSERGLREQHRHLPAELQEEVVQTWHNRNLYARRGGNRRPLDFGTHSILDISQVANQPAYGAASPLSDEVLEIIFGTTRPTRADIERQAFLLSKMRDREQATYIVVYHRGKPHEIYFTGRTGS